MMRRRLSILVAACWFALGTAAWAAHPKVVTSGRYRLELRVGPPLRLPGGGVIPGSGMGPGDGGGPGGGPGEGPGGGPGNGMGPGSGMGGPGGGMGGPRRLLGLLIDRGKPRAGIHLDIRAGSGYANVMAMRAVAIDRDTLRPTVGLLTADEAAGRLAANLPIAHGRYRLSVHGLDPAGKPIDGTFDFTL